MFSISRDKRINDFCNKLIKTKKWVFIRGKKHPFLKHIANGGFKTIKVSCTPSNNYAFEMLEREYYQYLRAFLIQTGVILA
ncbi:MAG: hypothetical protein J5965_20015 [Aeriscardovia sp.]|nr:hypothetical protein [Aeriscardovia sp.]